MHVKIDLVHAYLPIVNAIPNYAMVASARSLLLDFTSFLEFVLIWNSHIVYSLRREDVSLYN